MKPKIEFYRSIGKSFDGNTNNIGGLQTQAIELARELVKVGYQVTSYIKDVGSGNYDGVEYRPSSEYKGTGDINIGIDEVPFFTRGIGISWIHSPGLHCYAPELAYVVCNSQWTLDYYQEHRLSNNYIIIPCGFNLDSHKNNLEKKPNSIAMSGFVNKGFDRIPEIFKRVKEQIPEVTFDVFGGAKLWGQKESDYEDIYQAVRNAGITYHGLVTKDVLWNFYETCSIYFSPRCKHTETFGLSLIEAMASGCVPICSAKGNQSYLVSKENGVLLPYNEGIDESEAIVVLLKDKKRLESLRNVTIESVKKYDWSEVIKSWEVIL